MKRSLLAAVAAASMFVSSEAFAQAVVVELSPDQRDTIREYVVQRRVPSANLRGDVYVGATLPAEVRLTAVPDAWAPTVRRYRYVHWNDKVVLVEPSSRRVVYIID